MKNLYVFAFLALFSAGNLLARDADTTLVNLSNALADAASVAVDAAQVPDDMEEPPCWFKNRSLRGDIKDLRKIANQLRDRAAKGKARGMVGKLKVKRLLRNLKTCNFLVVNGAAKGLEGFGAAWDGAREAIGAIVSEMCCGGE